MKREIKFRAKDLNDKWIYGDLERNFFGGNVIYGIVQKDNTYKQIKKETLGEYINRKDFHHKEIYEGDILEISGNTDNVDFVSDRVIVEWKEDECKFVLKFIQFKDDLLYFVQINPLLELNVIGNIYDNTNLLNYYRNE